MNNILRQNYGLLFDMVFKILTKHSNQNKKKKKKLINLLFLSLLDVNLSMHSTFIIHFMAD